MYHKFASLILCVALLAQPLPCGVIGPDGTSWSYVRPGSDGAIDLAHPDLYCPVPGSEPTPTPAPTPAPTPPDYPVRQYAPLIFRS